MARPSKIWFRKDIGWWMVTISGKKTRLAKGRKSKKAAEQKFHELMLARYTTPNSNDARVVDLIEAFLAHSAERNAATTHEADLFYAQRFADNCGLLSATELKAKHITNWVARESWSQTTPRNTRRLAHRVMSWAKEEQHIGENPLQGMKCPPAATRKRSLSDEELHTIIATSHGPFRILIWSLRQTGARPCELPTLTGENVQTDRLILTEHMQL